jgi:hypothetical protein
MFDHVLLGSINGPVMLSEAKHLWLALETGCRK